jgi:hypothetical protein
MLNLSDKELDRLAQQAADDYEPGGLSGRGHWDKLEAGLNKELGRPRPNLFRTIRRMPFYYAPAVLLLLGASYYFIRHGKGHLRPDAPVPTSPIAAKTEPSGGSPPLAVVKPLPQRPGQADNDGSATTKKIEYKATSTPRKETGKENKGLIKDNTANGSDGNTSVSASGNTAAGGKGLIANANGSVVNNSRAPNTHGHRYNSQNDHSITQGHGHDQRARAGMNEDAKLEVAKLNAGKPRNENDHGVSGMGATDDKASTKDASPIKGASPTKDASLSIVREQVAHAQRPVVDDSGLRDISSTASAKRPGPITLGKSHSPSLRIDRPLQIGLSVAPDFASVNNLAGDRPGSSFGLTLDYQIVNKLYIGTGFLYSRKNYAATAQDYHVPYGYYQANNMHDVDFVKGSINFLEIPLNLRYDFSVAGNTTFFASGGMSSYFLTKENCTYFYQLFGRETSRGFNYQNNATHLFSSVNLSIGVETGLSNDFSLLVAPYMKLPAGGIGFGQVDISSVGINMSLKYAPVLKRTRHR